MRSLLPLRDDNRSQVLEALRTDFGRGSHGDLPAVPRLHTLAESIEKSGSYRCMVCYNSGVVEGVIYLGVNRLAVVAGLEECAFLFSDWLFQRDWLMMIGDFDLTKAMSSRIKKFSWWFSDFKGRKQLFMAATKMAEQGERDAPLIRPASVSDLDVITDFAANLHVDDKFGRPLNRRAVESVRQRMLSSIDNNTTWIIEYEGLVAGKVDFANLSYTYGAQIAGVFVDRRFRGLGLGKKMISAATYRLLQAGLPLVSLHVRDGNTSALQVYKNAGFEHNGELWLCYK